tara:strand:+ start:736 stop:891 length:156 start_codon:yes stop_codon:yes gene_type:complete
MGFNPFILSLIGFSGFFFIVAFLLSSKNLDAEGIMQWMLEKPEDWIGRKKY